MPRKPVSPRKLAANRANAARSTGPRTPAGKAASSQNARKHRFAPSDFPVVSLEGIDDILELRADLVLFYQPVNSEELAAVERIAIAQQALLRSARLESGLFTACLNRAAEEVPEPMPLTREPFAGPGGLDITRGQKRNFFLAEGFHRMNHGSQTWKLFLRYQAQTERNYRRAIQEFERLKALRPPGAQPMEVNLVPALQPESPNEPKSGPQPPQPEELPPPENEPTAAPEPPPSEPSEPPAEPPAEPAPSQPAAASPRGKLTTAMLTRLVAPLTPFLALLPLFAQPLAPVDPALAEIARTRRFAEAAVSPDGARVTYVLEQGAGKSAIYLTRLATPQQRARITAGDGKSAYDEHAAAWSPDSKQIAFLSDREKQDQLQLWVAPADGMPARQLTHLKGLLAEPRWSPDGKRIALLFTENLPRAAGPLDPVLPQTGVLDSQVYEQRLAIVDAASGAVRQVSPPDMYIYEYDWSPDGSRFAVTAAKGEGDNNWWIAQLYSVSAETGAMTPLYKPGVQQQIAAPRWSPDSRSIVFIGGLMSDEGFTGGDLFQVAAAGGEARNLTPAIRSSASNISWPKASKSLYFTEHFDGGSAISSLDPATGQSERLWQADETISPFLDSGISLSANGAVSALIRQSFSKPPEVWAGRIGEWKQITRENVARKALWGEAKSLHWTNENFQVQGWLLYPRDFDPAKKYPMVVAVHGGPASSLKPSWPRPGFNPTLLSQQGYFVLMPNPRGSYGQGEKFTLANVKNFGGGDLRDILAGVDEAVRSAPIDPARIGLTGWSYGGFMTMWAVTQTHRFRAAVAGAGIANWQSYYGENTIDQWMTPYFGASVYDDPAVYAKSSAINFIKRVQTPTLVLVGDGDGECPPPQSYEFWHALKTLGVKTEMVVYANEGHMFHIPAHQRDVLLRMIDWFNQNLR